MTAFDFANDPGLACLPAALRQRMGEVQRARIDSGNTARNGVTYRTAEKRRWVDDLMDWQDAGSPAAGRRALQARERELRAADKF
jgi:hypothetical protein